MSHILVHLAASYNPNNLDMKKLSLLLFAIATLTFLTTSNAQSQIKVPAPSPKATLTQAFGLGEITIEYSRPGMKDREIFGGLVPYDKIWRTGANKATYLKFTDDVKINGKDIPAGEYSLYTIPGKDEWTMIINKETELWGTSKYDAAKDQARITVKPQSMDFTVETFTIDINDMRSTTATINLVWENTMVTMNVSTEIDERIMADIEKQTAGVSPNVYFAASRYYFENDKDLDQALKWIDMAQEKEQKFWMMRWKARMLAKKGDYKAAIAAAEKSSALAVEAKNEDYPRMNAESIAEWKKK